MAFDWKAIVKQAAPYLGTALGGPLGGAAGKLIAVALGGDETKATPDDLAKLIQNITPEQLLALKNADQAYSLQLKALDINEVKDLEALAVQDRASARDRQAKLMDQTPRNLAYMGGIIWVVLNTLMILMAFRGYTFPTDMATLIGRALGTLDALVGTAWAFFLGTTAHAGRAQELLYQSTPQEKP